MCNIRQELSYEIDNCLEILTSEIIFLDNKNVGCLYRTPNSSITEFNDRFCEYMRLLNNKTLYLCGDFNIDLIKYNSHNATNVFLNNLFSFGMFPLIRKPTRITCTSSTLIDNIFTNDVSSKLYIGLIINDITDHLRTIV